MPNESTTTSNMMLVHPEAPLLTKNDPLRGTYESTFSVNLGDLSGYDE
jgi:hypothetical protein